MWRAATILAAATVAVAGCGGSSSEDVRSTVRSYIDAFVNGDGAKACSLMTGPTRRLFVTRVRPLTKTTDCATAINTIRGAAAQDTIDGLKRAKISEVKVSGDTATVKLTAGKNSSTAKLVKQGGAWKVAGVPGTK